MDRQKLAQAARRANAAYLMREEDSRGAFEALGDTWVAMYANASHQAIVSVDAHSRTFLSISGTRVSALKLMDVFCDVSLEPVPVAGGAVTAGVYEGMQALWDWVLQVVPAGDVINVTGHSLGGARTHLTPLFLPVAQIGALHAFEAPKFADAAFYATHATALAGMVCVLNGADLWAAWPWKDDRWQARPQPLHVWIKDDAGAFEMIPASQWPGGDNPADHDMSRVQARCEAMDQLVPAD